ncbi:MAG: hypothetical protein AB1425_05745 [Actinomycetota bacterium]
MIRTSHKLSGVSRISGIVLVLALVLVWASVAQAQSAEDFYEDESGTLLAQPSGPAAGVGCSTIESDDGLLNAGDLIVFPGGFSVAPGASVVLEDADGTQGTLIDGVNAEIAGGGGISLAVTGDPLNVAGGDGVLSDEVCDSIVTTTGVAGAAGAAGVQAASTGVAGVVGVLPSTGGPLIAGLLGALALLGTGLAILRRTGRRG